MVSGKRLSCRVQLIFVNLSLQLRVLHEIYLFWNVAFLRFVAILLFVFLELLGFNSLALKCWHSLFNNHHY